MLECVDKEGRHTELSGVFQDYAVVAGVEGSFEVRARDADVHVVDLGVFHHHDEGGEGFANTAEEAKSVFLFA
jgi:hypothetical protein